MECFALNSAISRLSFACSFGLGLRSFKTVLHRKLQKLQLSGDVSKTNRKKEGHMGAFYYIFKKNLSKIKAELDRELAHKKFDEIWSAFSPEQRKSQK